MIWLCFSQANHIIFEQVGEMASSVTYLHVKMEVDIQAIEEQIERYQIEVVKLKSHFAPMLARHLHNLAYWHGLTEGNEVNEAKAHSRYINNTLDGRYNNSKKFTAALTALKQTLPEVEQEAPTRYRGKRSVLNMSLSMKKVINDVSGIATKAGARKLTRKAAGFALRQPRSILALGLGTLGTFMGLFNTFQIHNLKKELGETRQAHNRLVEVVQGHEEQLQNINNTIGIIKSTLSFMRHGNTGLLLNFLKDAEDEIWHQINIVTHTLQVAQTRRLAIDFLPAEHLPALYERLETQAKNMEHKLITRKPSDLFQLELSYFFDGDNVQLLLHVPAVPHDTILRLLKLHPFPLPLNKNYSVIPLVQDDLLAISSGFTRYSTQLSSVDLLGCHAINNVYLCERHGVLGKQLNGSCLGALYLQNFDSAQELCPLHVRPIGEVVKQLLDNWFLIFSPNPQTAYVSCRNGTNNEAYFKSGITRIHLSPGCRMNLNAHLLQADFSMHLPDDIVNFQWDWDITKISETIDDDMNLLLEAGNTDPTLKDLKDLQRNRFRSVLFRILIVFIISVIALGLVILVIGWYYARDLILSFRCIRKKDSPQIRELLDTTEPTLTATNAPLFYGPQPRVRADLQSNPNP
jgi:hypothetical protein